VIWEELIQQLLKLSIKEFKEKAWGSTEQYLEVSDVVAENGVPVIKRIEQEADGCYSVYFPVKDERFYYTHYFTFNPELSLSGVYVSAANTVYLSVHSSDINLEDILGLTSLLPSHTWQKGDLRWQITNSLAEYKDSGFNYEPDENEAGNFERKLLNLLENLINHQQEFTKLKQAGCSLHIQAYLDSYIANGSLNVLTLTNDIINYLHLLELDIDFDLYASGVPFK
jgi:hypothetical protein